MTEIIQGPMLDRVKDSKYHRLCRQIGVKPLPTDVRDDVAYAGMVGHLIGVVADARDIAERAARGEDVRHLARLFLRHYSQDND